MRIVRAGIAPDEAPEDARRRVLGLAVCAAIVTGWVVTALSARLQGTNADRNAWLLAGIGILTGVIWSTKRFGRLAETSLQVLLVAAVLQATAATLAFDRGVIAAWPFAMLLAVCAGQVGRTRGEVAAQAGLLAGGQLLAGLLGPDRAAGAVEATLVLVPALLLVAVASAAVREQRESGSGEEPDIGLLHARLATAVAAHPDRFAVLLMDGSGVDRERLTALLAGEVRDTDDVVVDGSVGFSVLAADTDRPGAAALARRIEHAMREFREAEIGALNAAIGIAVFPEDGRTPDELLAALATARPLEAAAR